MTALLVSLMLLDRLTTSSILAHGGYERDPVARPFVRSVAGIGLAVAIPLSVRRARPATQRALEGVEAAMVVNNVRVIRSWR